MHDLLYSRKNIYTTDVVTSIIRRKIVSINKQLENFLPKADTKQLCHVIIASQSMLSHVVITISQILTMYFDARLSKIT